MARVEPVVALWADEDLVRVFPSDGGWFGREFADLAGASCRADGSWEVPIGELEGLCSRLDRAGAVWALQWRAAPRTWAERMVAEVSSVAAAVQVLRELFAALGASAQADAALLEAAVGGLPADGELPPVSAPPPAQVLVVFIADVPTARVRVAWSPPEQVLVRLLQWREGHGPPEVVVTVAVADAGLSVEVHTRSVSHTVPLSGPAVVDGPLLWWLWPDGA